MTWLVITLAVFSIIKFLYQYTKSSFFRFFIRCKNPWCAIVDFPEADNPVNQTIPLLWLFSRFLSAFLTWESCCITKLLYIFLIATQMPQISFLITGYINYWDWHIIYQRSAERRNSPTFFSPYIVIHFTRIPAMVELWWTVFTNTSKKGA